MGMQQLGQSTIRGCDGNMAIAAQGGGSSAVAATQLALIGIDFTDEVQSNETRNGNNDVFAVGYSGRIHKVTFKAIPIGVAAPATQNSARTAIALLGLGAIITITNSGVGSSDGAVTTTPGQINGTWNYAGGGSYEISPSGESMVWTIPAVRYATSGNTPAALAVVT